jgi:hypothetical protein
VCYMITKLPKLETVEILNRLNDLVREHLSTEPNDPRNAEIKTHLAELSRLILKETSDLAKSPPMKPVFDLPTVKDFHRRMTELGLEYGKLLHHDPRRIEIASDVAELYALRWGRYPHH